ncbi:iron-containing redox enzyme family protein [Microbacterium marinilacus]|uniref:iron-containing redox enzyme family protein n=1 Tax=Microbacterium marinilacus TaxID=415209 RepID=UPI003557258E
MSEAVITRLTGAPDDERLEALAQDAVTATADIVEDDDLQLALFALYASSYGSLDELSPELEWDPRLIATRRILEQAFEQRLRAMVPMPDLPEPSVDAVARALFALTEADSGPSLSRYLAKKATAEQAHEFFMQRSIYTLREADPHSWAIPRLHGRAKAALVEIQSDEYGGGRADRVHATIFAAAMRGAGLDDTYGAYVDDVPAVTLASHNTMSMFGVNRRLVGAIVGHLAAFEMTSSIPNRFYGDGLRRLGFGEDVTDYFDEHVEADAVHEQIAGRDLAGALAEDRPDLLPDIMFGAAACLAVDGWVGAHMLDAWQAGESSLRAVGHA